MFKRTGHDHLRFLTFLATLSQAMILALPAPSSAQETPLTVRSKDGTPIALYCGGAGPALLLVHGGSGDHSRWNPVLPAFTAAAFRVCAMDRRGHGQSGDAQEYSLDREIEDVVAVADSLKGPVTLVAHSFGAICAAEAALRSKNIGKLVLYEPPFPANGPITSPEVLAKFEQLVRSGQNDAALEMFLREIVKLPDVRIAAAQKDPDWAARASAIGVQVRELRAVNAYTFSADKFAKLRNPTLLVTGSETAEHHRIALEALNRALPNRTLATLQGQGHDGIQSAPALFARAVLDFLKSGAAN